MNMNFDHFDTKIQPEEFYQENTLDMQDKEDNAVSSIKEKTIGLVFILVCVVHVGVVLFVYPLF